MNHGPIICRECIYKAGDTLLYGSLYYPDTHKKYPGLLLFPAWRGKDAFALEQAKRLAEQGYVVLAADPYGKKEPALEDGEAEKRMKPLFEDRALLQSRANAAFEQLKSEKQVDSKRIGALGFCFGGLTALELLRLGVSIQGIVSLHGVLSDEKGTLQAKIGTRKKDLSGKQALFLHGHDDPLVSQKDLVMLQNTLTQANVDWTLTIYGHTSHAFTNPEANNPGAGLIYNPKIAMRAWRTTLDFFEELFS